MFVQERYSKEPGGLITTRTIFTFGLGYEAMSKMEERQLKKRLLWCKKSILSSACCCRIQTLNVNGIAVRCTRSNPPPPPLLSCLSQPSDSPAAAVCSVGYAKVGCFVCYCCFLHIRRQLSAVRANIDRRLSLASRLPWSRLLCPVQWTHFHPTRHGKKYPDVCVFYFNPWCEPKRQWWAKDAFRLMWEVCERRP